MTAAPNETANSLEWEGYLNGLVFSGNLKSRVPRGYEGTRVLNDIRDQIDAEIKRVEVIKDGHRDDEAASRKPLPSGEAGAGEADTTIRDALRYAAIHVALIPPEHNRDQAQSAVLAFLRSLVLANRQTADFRSLILSVRGSRDCPDWWPVQGVKND